MFKTGDKIDVYDNAYTQLWHVCTVVEYNDDNIKIHYDGYDEQYEEWIDKKCKRLASYNSHTLNYTELELPPSLTFGYPSPLFYYDKYHNNQYIIISAIFSDTYIYAFDISNNKFIKYCEYPLNINPMWHAAGIDDENDKLYIISGSNSNFAVLDLLSKQWKCYDNQDVPLMVLSQTIYIKSLHELHVFGDGNTETHFKYDKLNMLNPFEILPGIDDNKTFRNSIMIYVELKNKLFMFGGWNGIFLDPICYDDIWFCDLQQYGINEYKWELYPVKLPQKQKHFCCVLGFDALIFVFYIRNDLDKSIWCLDLTSNKWYKSHKTFPCNFGEAEAVKTKDNFVHFMQCIYSDAPYHVNLSLYDIIPLELNKVYEKKYNPIVYGFIRKQIDNSIIPISLIDIILNFIPYFGF